MIRTVASSLRRGAVAAGQGEQRRLATHPPSPLPCRGFHGGAVSGLLLRPGVAPPPEVLPSLSAMPGHLTTAKHIRMYTTGKNSIEETKGALLRHLLDDEVAAAAERRMKEEMRIKEKLAEEEKARKRALAEEENAKKRALAEEEKAKKRALAEEEMAKKGALAAEKKALAEELLAQVRRQVASSVVHDQNDLLLATLAARWARDGEEMEKLKEKLEGVEKAMLAGFVGFFGMIICLVFGKTG